MVPFSCTASNWPCFSNADLLESLNVNSDSLFEGSLRRRGITDGTLLLAILCKTGLKVCRLLSADKTALMLDPDIEDCHTIHCQLECGDTYPIKLNLDKHKQKV